MFCFLRKSEKNHFTFGKLGIKQRKNLESESGATFFELCITHIDIDCYFYIV